MRCDNVLDDAQANADALGFAAQLRAAAVKPLEIVEVGNPQGVRPLGFINTSGGANVSANAIDVVGELAFVAGSSGLQIFDISDAAQPRSVGSHRTTESCEGVAVIEHFAILDVGEGGLHIPSRLEVVDVSDPTQPRAVGELWDSWAPRSALVTFAIQDEVLYYPGRLGLYCIDVSNLPAMREIGLWKSNFCEGVVVSDHIAYVVGIDGLKVLDVSNPAQPRLAGSIIREPGAAISRLSVPLPMSLLSQPACRCSTSATQDRQSWLLSTREAKRRGLDTFDVSIPATPRPLGTFSNPAYQRAIQVHGDLAFLTGGGLLILNISDARNIRQISHYAPAERTEQGLAVEGNLAFLGTYWTGLHIIDISQPQAPRRMAIFQTQGPVVDVATRGEWVFVGTAGRQQGLSYVGQGIHVLNISDPSNPKLVVSDPTWPSALLFAGQDLFVSAGSAGLMVFELPSFTRIGELRAGLLTLEWNLAGLGMTLERKSRLGDSGWTPVIGSENTNRFSVRIQNEAEFFRLIHR